MRLPRQTVLVHCSEGSLFRRLGLEIELFIYFIYLSVKHELGLVWLGLGLELVDLRNRLIADRSHPNVFCTLLKQLL